MSVLTDEERALIRRRMREHRYPIQRRRQVMAQKASTAAKRAEQLRVRGIIVKAIEDLERKHGESPVSGAFARHTQIRRERRKLDRAQAEINEKIAKLKR